MESINQLNSLSENNSNDIELENEYDSESGMSEVGSCGYTFSRGPDPRKIKNAEPGPGLGTPAAS